MKKEVTTDNTEIQRTVRHYYEQTNGNKMGNLEEMDRFLEKFNLPRMNQKKRNYGQSNYKHWNQNCDKKSPKNQKPKTRRPHRWIPANVREELMPILPKLFQKIPEGTLPNSFFEATITLIPKPDKDNTQKRNLQGNITDEHRCKNPQQNFSKQNSRTH